MSIPSAPKDLSAVNTPSSVVLTWSPPDSDGGLPITSYRIQRAQAAYEEAGVATSFEDFDLPYAGTYEYTVTAVNADGEGPPSNEASVVRVSVHQETHVNEGCGIAAGNSPTVSLAMLAIVTLVMLRARRTRE